MTFKTFKSNLRSQIWPFPGEPKHQIASHNNAFVEALIDLQRWVECLQVNNTTVHPFCSTYMQCGKTVVEAPFGRIKRVFTVVGDDQWCDPVYYRSASFDDIECWSRSLVEFVEPLNVGLPRLPQGYRAAEASADSVCGRARGGAWAINRNRLYITPWIQSNERVVIEWDGNKKVWNDLDEIDENVWTADVAKAIKLFVRASHETEYGCDPGRTPGAFFEQYRLALADLIWECRNFTEQQEQKTCLDSTTPTQAELDDDSDAEPDSDVLFAFISDYRRTGNGTAGPDVAALVDSWNPQFIVTGGDNIYGSSDYDYEVGGLYGKYITDDVATNRFWPAVGNHDWNDGGIENFYSFFTLPNNERYYDFVKGEIQFFIVSDDANEPDLGYVNDATDTSGSIVGKWLKAKMKLSSARWKIVVIQNAPYTSATNDKPGHPYVRWPFKAWGADIVLSGDSHLYQRLEVGGLPYIVAGWSGAVPITLFSPDPNAAYTKYSLSGSYGALKVTGNCDELKFEAITREGTVVDTLTLTK